MPDGRTLAASFEKEYGLKSPHLLLFGRKFRHGGQLLDDKVLLEFRERI